MIPIQNSESNLPSKSTDLTNVWPFFEVLLATMKRMEISGAYRVLCVMWCSLICSQYPLMTKICSFPKYFRKKFTSSRNSTHTANRNYELGRKYESHMHLWYSISIIWWLIHIFRLSVLTKISHASLMLINRQKVSYGLEKIPSKIFIYQKSSKQGWCSAFQPFFRFPISRFVGEAQLQDYGVISQPTWYVLLWAIFRKNSRVLARWPPFPSKKIVDVNAFLTQPFFSYIFQGKSIPI